MNAMKETSKMEHTKIQFLNHASVVVICDEISILTDPWFSGDAFHKGWNLLFENLHDDILSVLSTITHIWISHEHPDHFSVLFFKKYKEVLIQAGVTILFQETTDKRVVSFLRANKFNVLEIPVDRKIKINDEIDLSCIRDGFYDSALLIEHKGEKILNLNDCEVNNVKRALEVFRRTGKVDVLLSQFSYAAWKGGKANKTWRKNSAAEKIETLILQVDIFSPKILIPFASFIYFSNELNSYLNDSINTLEDVSYAFKDKDVFIATMRPGDVLENPKYLDVQSAVEFWNSRFLECSKKTFQ